MLLPQKKKFLKELPQNIQKLISEKRKVALLKAWAEENGYFLETHKNMSFDGIYNCYIRRPNMPEERCVKAFLYGSEFNAVEAACKWLSKSYKKVKRYPTLS